MPPKRQPTLPPTEQGESGDDSPAENLNAEEERLQRLVAEKQQRGRIAALRRELAGETPAREREGHKRGLSTSSSTSSQAKRVHIRAKEPTTYE
jgi:hypothetical protein